VPLRNQLGAASGLSGSPLSGDALRPKTDRDEECLLGSIRAATDTRREPSWTRRDVLKLGALIAAGGVAAPLIAACSTPGRGEQTPVARPIIVISHAGDPGTEPALLKVFDDFKAQHPDIAWDIRELPGGGPEWDRLARGAMASGEPVDLVEINGQQLRGWVRDGLLADLGADPEMAEVLARVPDSYHLSGPGESTTRAFPLAVTRGVHTTGIYYNKALLDRADLGPPATIADLKAMVAPLAALGVAPLVHPSGDVFFNQVLVTWLLPMIAERSGDPLAFADRTVRGEVRYDSPEWIETFETIADLRASGVLLEGSGAVDYATMQQLFLQGKAATTFNGTWLLPQLLAGSPTGPFDLHVAPPPLVDGASRPRPILAWTGFALPAQPGPNRDSTYEFLRFASEPAVDKAVVDGLQVYSPLAASNVAIENAIAQEFLPMFADAITPMDWLWEPEITAEIDNQVQALVRGDSDPRAAGIAIEAAAQALRTAGRGYYP
jgi:ABC-type glycerol-3-phosphate transport system substrate-binding protein